jgi:predicted kinase
MKLFVPIGIPGSGKSTWCRRMLDADVVSSDDIRIEIWGSLRTAHDVSPEQKKRNNRQVWDLFYERVQFNLHYDNVVADGTNLRDYARERLRNIAYNRCDATIHAIVFNNTTQAFKRNKRRSEDQWVPDDVMNDFLGQFNEEYTVITNEQWDSYTEIGRLD